MAGNRSQTKRNPGQIAGAVITLTGAALWGLNAVVSKFLMTYGIDTMWMANFRMITSGLVLLVCVAFRNPCGMFDIWKDRKSVMRLLVIALLAFGVCQLTYYLSIRYSNAGIAAALQQTAPVFVLIYVIMSERRRPTRVELIAVPVVLIGSWLIATHGDIRVLAIHPVALAAGLISALMSALYITVPPPLIRRYGTMETVGWGLFIGGCFLAPFCKLWNFPDTWDATMVAGMIFIIVPGAAMAFGLYLYGASIVGPVRAGVYNLFEPAVAAVASAVFLSQAFHAAEVAGIILILLGIGILTVTGQGSKSDGPR